MRSAISPSFNVSRVRSIASTLLCFAILAAEAPTAFACTSTYLSVYNDDMYVYAYADMSVSGCNPCYAQIDLTLTSPSNRSGYTSVYNNPGQTYITAQVSLPINADAGTWTGSADYTSDNSYQRVQTQNIPAPYVQITANSMSPSTISVSGANGVATCGTDDVTVAVFRGGLGYPTFTVNFIQSAGSGQVSVPSDQMRTANTSPIHVAPTNGVCAVNAGNDNRVRGTITNVSSGYTIVAPNPPGNADSNAFTVGP